MNFYNYIIGRLYSWALRRENDTPIANVVFTMCIVHYFQMFTIYLIARWIFNFPDIILGINRLYIGVFMIVFFIVYYLLMYNREKWDEYVHYIEKESLEKQRKGKLLVLTYLLGSILLFFVSLPIIFG